MSQVTTNYATIDDHESGSITIISKDDKKNYVFSNMYEVSASSKPYERVAVAKNFEYVIESVRAEGVSPWYSAAHDEFAVAMDYPVTVELVKLDDPIRETGTFEVPVRFSLDLQVGLKVNVVGI